MASSFTVGRSQLLFALCLPLAILLGYLLSDPLDRGNSLVALIMMGGLSIPLLMRGYHVALIFAWNAAITPVMLPGQPFLWVPLACLGLGFAVINRFVNPEVRFVSVPSVSKPLLFLLVVLMGTAVFRGGFGLRSFGSESYGGRDYVYIVAAILGYFALSSQRIPIRNTNRYIDLYFLPGLTGLIPNLAYLGGSSYYFLFYLFPPIYASEQARGDFSLEVQITRVFGLTAAASSLFCWVLGKYGLRRVFQLSRPWPAIVMFVAFLACAFCGFRSMLIIFSLTMAFQLWFERLFTVRVVASLLGVFLLAGALLIPNADKLPLVVQRTMSFLPLHLNPVVEMSAQGSSNWRLQMWQELLPDVPKYFFAGKGFAIDPTELAFAEQNTMRFGLGYGGSKAAGDYHNGPLSLVIPLGVWGVIGFIWFCIAAVKYLHHQYRYGNAELHRINTFLLAYFLARLVLFIFVFGGFFSDLFIFTGLIGFSVSLNGTNERQLAESQLTPQLTPHEIGFHEQMANQRVS